MKNKVLFVMGLLAITLASASCTANKKKKCDTCPKWTSEMPTPEISARA